MSGERSGWLVALMGVGTATTKNWAALRSAGSAVKVMSHPSKASLSSSSLGSMPCFICSTRPAWMSKPMTRMCRAKAKAMGRPT